MKKNLIKNIMLFLLFLIILNMVVAQEDISMYIEIVSENGISGVGEVGLSEGKGSNLYEEFPEYYAVVSSLSNDFFQVNYSLYDFVHFDDFAEGTGGIDNLDRVSIFLFFPFYRDVDKLDVYSFERGHLLTYDLSHFRVCVFDGICGPGETADICPEDCGEPELVEKADEDFEERYEEAMKDKEVVEELSFIEQNQNYLIISLGVLIFLLLILIFKNRKK